MSTEGKCTDPECESCEIEADIKASVEAGETFIDDENGLLVENDAELQQMIKDGLAFIDTEGHIHWLGPIELFDCNKRWFDTFDFRTDGRG